MKKIIIIIARCLLGLVFVVFGLNGFLNFIPVPEMPEQADKFMGVLADSGFLHVVKILEIAGGALLLSGRYVPLGLTLLGPVIVNILLFHIFLDLGGLPMAIVLTLLEAYLIWWYRKHFKGIFAAK